jgi:hypothetical protein
MVPIDAIRDVKSRSPKMSLSQFSRRLFALRPGLSARQTPATGTRAISACGTFRAMYGPARRWTVSTSSHRNSASNSSMPA